jgi:hypothetical protein
VDRLDPARPVVLTPDKIMRDLEDVRLATFATGAFALAIRCSELQGKHIGLWRSEAAPERTLEQLVNESLAAERKGGEA